MEEPYNQFVVIHFEFRHDRSSIYVISNYPRAKKIREAVDDIHQYRDPQIDDIELEDGRFVDLRSVSKCRVRPLVREK